MKKLEFTWEWSLNYNENLGRMHPTLSILTIYTETDVKNYMAAIKNQEKLGYFIAYEKHIDNDKEKNEFTLTKLIVPIPSNPKNEGIMGFEIFMYNNTKIEKLVGFEPKTINRISEKAASIYKLIEQVDERKAKLAKDLGDLGF